MKPQKIAVIGGVAAGTAAAAEAKRVDPEADVVLFEKGPYISYGACEMPLVVAGTISDAESLIAFTPQRFAAERGVTVRANTLVDTFDPRSGELKFREIAARESTRDSAGVQTTERFDKFILATGARPVRPDLEGVGERNVFVLRELTDVQCIQSFCDRLSGAQHAVVVGGGFVGIEVADALITRGFRVTMLQSGAGPLHRNLEPLMAGLVRERLERGGVAFRKERLTGFERSGGQVVAVKTDAGEMIGCQLVILAMGTAPNTDLGTEAGVKLGKTGGFAATDAMKTNLSNVWACGDCVEVRRNIDSAQVLSPLSLTAFRSARVAGTNAARRGRVKQALFPGVVGAQALKIFEEEVAFAGLTESEARAAGFQPASIKIRHRTAAGLFPGSSYVHVLLIFDLARGRLLGGQLVGGPGTALRADILIPVIRSGGTVYDLYNLDLIYAPPFSPRLDPVLVAAKKAIGVLALR